jgi:predicted permease
MLRCAIIGHPGDSPESEDLLASAVYCHYRKPISMDVFLHHLSLAMPLFLLVFVGYAAMRISGWPTVVSDSLTRFVFSLAIPAMLFRLMSDSAKLTQVDTRLLIAFFGGCLIVFVIGRLLSWQLFALDGVSQSVFALGGVFSNCVMLGLPMAKLSLGDAAVPSVALVLVFNALILWTLVTVSVEWAKNGSLSIHGFARTARGVLTNPVVVGILSGTFFGMTGWSLPHFVDETLGMVALSAAPMALIALGMGLAEYGVREGWRISIAVSFVKLIIFPMVVWGLCWLLALPPMETQVVVLLSSMSVGANVYLMSRQFKALEGPTASSLVLSTALAAITTPIVLALVGA